MEKKQKIMLGVLGAAALIVAIDQLILLPSDEDETPVARTAPSPAAADAPAAPESSVNVVAGVSQALESVQVRLTGNRADAFMPRGPWLTTVEENGPDLDAQDVAEAERAFAASHRLTSVLDSGDVRGAIINGKFVALGESVDGFTLVNVRSRSVELRAGDAVVSLRMSAPLVDASEDL